MKVTIIIPTYNYAHYIKDAIDSVLKSDFPQSEIEIIVIDDGSTDSTQEVIKKYDDRVNYIYQENQGKACATQVGIHAASGDYIFNLDADDLFLKNKISEVVKIFEQNSDVVHVAHPALCWNFEQNSKSPESIPEKILGKIMDGKRVLEYFYKRNILFGGGSTFAARATALKKFTIPSSVDMFTDEYLVLFTLNQGSSFFLPEALSVWRIHGKNYSNNSQSLVNQSKLNRSFSSQKSVRDSVLMADFADRLKSLKELDYKVAELFYKEQINQKNFGGIIGVWNQVFFGLNYSFFEKLSIAKRYTVFNRSIPLFLLNLARKYKKN